MTADRIFASVWTSDLATQLALIPNRKGVTWQDPLNGAGQGSLQVPYDDPAANYLTNRNIVRFWWAGDYRYAYRIKQPTNVAVDQNGEADRWLTVAGPGVLDTLNDAVLYPEGGLSRNASDQRAFTFASAISDWYISAEWVAPTGVAWTADTTARAGYPKDWPDPTADWIWDTSPETTDTDLKVVYFRSDFTLAADSPVCIYATADNFFDLYLNGQLIISSDITDTLTWRRTSKYTANLPAGTYTLAARVQNAAKAWSTQANPAAFLCTVAETTSVGVLTTVVRRTDTTNWLCRPEGSTPPGWAAAQILKTFVEEAQARTVGSLTPVTFDFTATNDTDGNAWTDVADRSFAVGTTKGLDLVQQLTELAIDVQMGPDLVLHAWKHRGTDKSTGAGQVVLRPALNLKQLQLATQLGITTSLLVRTPSGWIELASSNVVTDGRYEDCLSLGNAGSDVQATAQATAAFDDISEPVTTFTAACIPVAGATPYVDFDNGDTVLAPDGAGGSVALRVMGLTVTEDSNTGVVSFVPELYDA